MAEHSPLERVQISVPRCAEYLLVVWPAGGQADQLVEDAGGAGEKGDQLPGQVAPPAAVPAPRGLHHGLCDQRHHALQDGN